MGGVRVVCEPWGPRAACWPAPCRPKSIVADLTVLASVDGSICCACITIAVIFMCVFCTQVNTTRKKVEVDFTGFMFTCANIIIACQAQGVLFRFRFLLA